MYTRTPVAVRRVVVRRLTPSYRVGALALVVRPDGRMLLLDQPYLSGWCLPGGDLKRGEKPHVGLARELMEELGFQVTLPLLSEAWLRTHDRWVTFIAPVEVTDEVADGIRPRSAEVSRVGWFAPGELPELDGDAVGPLTLLGVLPA